MKISQALAGVQVLGVDTSPFIYLVEKHPVYEGRVVSIFQEVNSGAIQAVTSMLTLTEVLTMPLAKKQPHYVREYREMLLNTQSIVAVKIDQQIAERAAELRARYGLKTPDAMQVATCLEMNCDALVTNDLGLKRVSELRVLVLDELEVD
ncbi:MAG: PIN domain-containing protein [Anaerolineae bacterium]